MDNFGYSKPEVSCNVVCSLKVGLLFFSSAHFRLVCFFNDMAVFCNCMDLHT